MRAPNPNLSGIHQGEITQPTQMVVAYEATPAPDGSRGVAFYDGHAMRVQEAKWKELAKACKLP